MAFPQAQPLPQTQNMQIKGLFTNSNEISEAPLGALSIADNIWISKDSIAESRRGFNFLPFALPNTLDRADALGQFQGSLLIHYNNTATTNNNDSLAYYDNSTGVNTYTGIFAHPDPLLARMKFVEANQNIYFTTADGVYKNDAISNNPVLAGMYQALDCTASLSTDSSGFFNNESEVAYRIIWGIEDANGNLILGAPSQRAIVANQSGGQSDVSLQITIPEGITVDHFFQIYRSDQAGGLYTNAELILQDLTYTAVTPGTPGNSITVAYTTGGTAGSEVVSVVSNAISVQIQSGVSTSVDVLAAINNSAAALALVSASITGLTTNVETAPASGDLAGGSVTLVTPDDNMQLVYEANPSSGDISAASVTVIDSVPESLKGADLYTNATQDGILQQNSRPPYCLDMALFQTCTFYANTQTNQQLFLTILAVGGSSGIQSGDVITIAGVTYTGGSSENVGTRTFQLVTGGSPAQNINDTSLSLIRVINQSSSTTAIYAFYVSSSSSLPGQLLIQARNVGASVFSVIASAHGSAYNPALPTSGTTVSSTNTANLNGLMYSKAGEPEAVPTLNIFYIGSASQPIRRIIPARNSLFILKDDGVFRCTGTAGNFAIDTLDTTVIILAPESAVSLNNTIYFLSTQGVVSISDNGGQVMSRPIENQLTALEGASLSALKEYTFGCSYESERQYNLWTISTSADTSGTQNFIYNYMTKTWTRSTRQQSHGMVLRSDNKMYCLNTNSNQISQERKSFDYTDYTDESYPVTISAIGGSGAALTLTDASFVVPGDLIYQSDSVNSIAASINYATNVVTMETVVSGWADGDADLLKSIPCLIEWLPNVANNAGYLKQYREVAVIFKQNGFSNANLNFYSEISGSIDSVPFSGSASGNWGTFSWGDGAPWGGTSRSKAFRTYVPLEKQRCDLLSVQFQCQNAWATFLVEGISTIFHQIGERMTN